MKTSTQTLIERVILTLSGEISKDKINLIAGAMPLPFAEMVWVSTGSDMDNINRLTDNTPSETASHSKLCKCSTVSWGYNFPMRPLLCPAPTGA